MSIKQAQEWLDRRRNKKLPLYAVMVQYEIGEATEYRLINTGPFGLFPTLLISRLEWALRHARPGKTANRENRIHRRRWI